MAILNATAEEISTNTTLAALLEDDEASVTGSETGNSSDLAVNETFVDCTTVLGNTTGPYGTKVTNLSEIPAKEIFIVIMMLGLWVYSIILTRKAWYRILKE